MNTKKLIDTALNGLDTLGFQLDQLGITGKVNRHNLAAFVMNEQKHLEGEWDSIQARIDRRRSQVEALVSSVEERADAVLRPVLSRIEQLRGAVRG
ncbi:hypothetical protein [Marinobacter zhejiangensis]|uniref:Uncharacterized protein n=1 Tax=Marinobacter zhejiangensis TaxID=488535 RepID=A0A1I4LC58_9GAMM|nr:hypothetical protein [Marinobacter zhejiangensis]SFL88625.1 hypothetical protein SAMN04487963_0404 [Marinobacter zhejiangensis]